MNSNLSVECSSDYFEYGTMCNFKCPEGYRNLGSRTRHCLPVAKWSGLPAKCKSRFY